MTGSGYTPSLRETGDLLQQWARHSEVVVLCATRAAGDEFVREHAGVGILGAHRYTLTQFALAVSSSALANHGLCLSSGLAAHALAARAIFEVNLVGGLPYFQPVVKMPGFPRVVASTLRELRGNRVTPAELLALSPPCQDLARLLQFHTDELARRNLTDLAELFDLAREAQHPLFGLPVICLDVETPTRVEADFLDAILRRASGSVVVRLESSEHQGSSALSLVRRWLFAASAPPSSSGDDSVAMFSAPGESLECVEIARRILFLAEEGTRFDQIAVLLRNPRRYQPLMEEALRRAKIPFYISEGTSRPDPSGRAFLILLSCAAEGCSATRFAEYVSTGQVPKGFTAPYTWEKLLADAAVIGGPARWTRRLEGLRNEIELQSATGDREQLERRVAHLEHLQTFALPLVDRLHGLPSSATWDVWIRCLSALAEYGLESPDSVLSVLQELEPMADVGPVRLAEVYSVLDDRLRFFRQEPSGRRYGSVLICSLDEVRGREFPVVFLPGLAEGLFPQRSQEDPLLLDLFRECLNAGLVQRDDKVRNERRLLQGAVGAATTKLIVSYPSMDTALSRSRVPSFYALEIYRAVHGTLPELQAFQRRNAAEAETSLSWPAPSRADHAIDDAEYDLASLRPHLAGASGPKGSARYLLDVSPTLARSLTSRGRRWRPGWFAHDGVVALDEKAQTALAASSLTKRAYSPSALQHYAQCPYRFALQSIFHLKPRETPAALQVLDPLTRGAIFHRVQFEMFRNWSRADLNSILGQVAAEYEDKLAPAIPRVWRSEIEELRIDLRAWLHDVTNYESDWQPVRSEYAFGLASRNADAHDPASSPEAAAILNGYRVRGSIDLVERNTQTGEIRIVDHKTGKKPDGILVSVGGGELLQPLIYALACEALLGDPAPSARMFYCTRRGGFEKVDIAASPQNRDRLTQVLRSIEDGILSGFLPAAPKKDACERCDYRIICGPYEEERVKRKKSEPLESLFAIRGLP